MKLEKSPNKAREHTPSLWSFCHFSFVFQLFRDVKQVDSTEDIQVSCLKRNNIFEKLKTIFFSGWFLVFFVCMCDKSLYMMYLYPLYYIFPYYHDKQCICLFFKFFLLFFLLLLFWFIDFILLYFRYFYAS